MLQSQNVNRSNQDGENFTKNPNAKRICLKDTTELSKKKKKRTLFYCKEAEQHLFLRQF